MISYYYGLFFKDTRIMLCLTIEGTLNSRKCGISLALQTTLLHYYITTREKRRGAEKLGICSFKLLFLYKNIKL